MEAKLTIYSKGNTAYCILQWLEYYCNYLYQQHQRKAPPKSKGIRTSKQCDTTKLHSAIANLNACNNSHKSNKHNLDKPFFVFILASKLHSVFGSLSCSWFVCPIIRFCLFD